jgi:prolipoprotein diacylglyceryltransferase
MMDILAFIKWNVSPEIFSIGSVSVRWYGLLFAVGFSQATTWANECLNTKS